MKKHQKIPIRKSVVIIGIMTILIFLNTNLYLSLSGEAILFVLFFVFSLLEFVANMGRSLSKICLYSLFIVGYTIVSSAFTQGHRSISMTVVPCMIFLSTLSWGLFKSNQQEIQFLENCYIFSLLIVELIMIMRPTLYYGLRRRYTLQFFNSIAIDPNFLAMYLVIGAIIILERLKEEQHHKKFFLSLLLVVTVICTFSTGSRGAVVGLLVALFFLYNEVLLEAIKKRPVIIPVILIVSIVVVIVIGFSIPQDITDRFFVLENYGDSSNKNRINLWKNSLRAIKAHLLFGNGVVDLSKYHNEIFGLRGDAHNTFLAVLEIYGLIGSFPFFVIAFEELKNSIKRKDQTNIALLLSVGIMAFIINALVEIPFWLAIIYIHMRNFQKKDLS